MRTSLSKIRKQFGGLFLLLKIQRCIKRHTQSVFKWPINTAILGYYTMHHKNLKKYKEILICQMYDIQAEYGNLLLTKTKSALVEC